MGAMGAATTVTYALLGLPGALLLGLIAALTEAIPIVGPLLGAIPAVLVAATVSPELAVVVGARLRRAAVPRGQRPRPARDAQHGRDLAAARARQPAHRRRGRRPRRRLPGRARRRAIEIVLSRLQARETPVAQDPAAVESPDEETTEDYKTSLPDHAKASS